MTDFLHLDTETFSPVPIKHGLYRYMEPVELMLLAWALNDEPVQLWDRTLNPYMPDELADHLFNSRINFVAHNAGFDRNVLRYALNHDTDPARWWDTAAQGRAHSLPGFLDQLCKMLKAPPHLQKMTTEGRDYIQMFCMPRPKKQKVRRFTRLTHPEEWRRFGVYCKVDVEATRWCKRRMPTWNYSGFERELEALDQKINDRGFAVDLQLAEAAVDTVKKAKAKLATRTQELTNDQVQRTTQRDKLLKHLLEQHGVNLPDMKASTIQRRIEDYDLPGVVRELLQIRLEAANTGASKYATLLRAVSHDGRLRGSLVWNGARRTGRWSGKVFQPHNLARVPPWVKKIYDEAADAVREGIAGLVYDPEKIISLISKLVRGLLVAPKGKKLVAADLKNIEGRGIAWEAGERWKLKAFEASDKGEGPEVYVIAYSRSFGVSTDVVIADDKAGGNMRQIGKVQELALGYQGAVGAFTTMAAIYGIDEDYLREKIPIPDKPGKKEMRSLQIVKGYRKANPNIRDWWYELEKMAKLAIRNPGKAYKCRSVHMQRDGAWFRVRLPSGRYLCYPQPGIDEDDKIYYSGHDHYTHQWGRIYTYGGKMAENITQAVARDVLAWRVVAIEKAGYPIVLTVHDEVITECPDTDQYTVAALSKLLATNPPWAAGLPLAADGFETYRYHK